MDETERTGRTERNGCEGNNRLTAEDMAETAGTITNEILSRMGSRLERIEV